MAKYWEDWSGSTLDAEPSGWTNRFATSATYTVQAETDTEAPVGRRLRIVTSAQARRFISFDAVSSDADRADCTVAVLFKSADLTTNAFGLGSATRGDGTVGSETATTAGLSRSSGNRNLRNIRYLAGAATFADYGEQNTGYTAIAGSWHWLVAEYSGYTTVLTLRTAADPTVVLQTVTYTGDFDPLAAGWVGLFTFANSMTWDVAAVAVATGADDIFFESPAADITAPVLSLPTGTTTGATTASGTVTTDEANGTLYAVVTASATPPSAADLRAGTGAVYSTSQAVSSTGVQNVAATGLTAETTYYWHFLHDDAADNASNIVTSASFTTDAATPISFSGTVSNQSYVEDAAITPLDLSGFFSGSETPFSYAVTTGTLPAGLSLNTSTGVISGTPTTPAAAVSIVVTATDAGTDTAATNAFDITITADVVVVKGVRVRLYDAAGDAAASITGIQAAWFDQPEPKDALAPVFKTSTASTDADGWLELDLDSTTALAVAANGFLIAYKLDATNHQDSAVFAGRLAVEDIA